MKENFQFKTYTDSLEHLSTARKQAEKYDGCVNIPPFQIDVEPKKSIILNVNSA